MDATPPCRVQEWCFPTDELRTEYLQSISSRSEADVFALLRLFLFEDSCFGRDSEYLHQAVLVRKDLSELDWLPTEYRRRLMLWIGHNAKPHPGIRWALDLLPHSPQQAINAITGYLNVYRAVRPDGRSRGLLDAAAIIRARWIDNLTTGTEALFRLSPRELELLIATLYQNLGYTVELTPPPRDGGRDVIATRQVPGQREVIDIECKTHTSPVGVEYVRQLRGVIERHRANRGVLVTISRCTRGARQETYDDSRLELIDGSSLTQMLNANFGPPGSKTEHGSAEASPEYERRRGSPQTVDVGQTRAQARSLVRWESVLTTLFGTVGGVVLGTFLRWAVVTASARTALGLPRTPHPAADLKSCRTSA